MIGARERTAAACACLLLTLAACVTTPKKPPPPSATPPGPPPLEASYDWHGLLLVPFGSALKEVPFKLHEVLLFRDAGHAAAADEAECYAIEQTAPRLVERTPSEYMLCFKHDRLVRVQATVNLPQSEAARILSDACGRWHKGLAGTPGPLAIAEAADTDPASCDGRDGAISYSGRLDGEADQETAPLTVTLDAAGQL